MRITSAVAPKAVEYMMSCGFKSTLDIINAASQSCRIPCFENDAAMGIVPYIQSGEAMPSKLAGTTPHSPHFLSRIRSKAA